MWPVKRAGRRETDSEYPSVLKTQNLLKRRGAQNATTSESAPNWNVVGTWLFVRPLTQSAGQNPNLDDGPFEMGGELPFRGAETSANLLRECTFRVRIGNSSAGCGPRYG